MKAIVVEKFGPPEVLQLKEVDKPIPKANEVLIRNYASSINTVDIAHRDGKAPPAVFWTARKLIGPILRLAESGVARPRHKIPGLDFAGKIVEVGSGVKDWNVGDEVYGYSAKNWGALAEFLVVPAIKLARKPSNLSFQEASAVPGGASPAIVGLKDLVKLEKGQKVLIIGASGGIGTFAVQIAKHIYDTEVTAVCGPNNIDMVKKIGADYVIDYTKGDYTKNQTKKYDVIFDIVGKNTFSSCKKILTKKGVFVSNNFMNSKRHLVQLITTSFGSKKLKTGVANEAAEVLNILKDWIENDKIKPVIDSIYPLEKAFEKLTQKVVEEVVKRNEDLPPTEVIKITTMAGCSTVKK